MRLEGIHHITAITGDAPRNVDFYAGVLGPAAGQEDRQPGRPDRLPPLLRRRARLAGLRPDVLRVPGRAPGPRRRRHGPPVVWRVGSDEALDFWAERLGAEGIETRARRRRCFADPEGLEHELAVADVARRAADARRTPRSRPSTRCRASTACAPTASRPGRSRRAARETLGFERQRRRTGRSRGDAARRPLSSTTPRRPSAACQGAGTVHHVAWASHDGRARGAGASASPTAARSRRR